MQTKLIYEFGPFCLNPAERQLLRAGQPVTLSPQLFSLLVALVENAGHLLSKEELRNKVWGKAFVSEDALKVIVGNLRKALGNGGRGDPYIENVRGGGYRFIAEVKRREQIPQSHIMRAVEEVPAPAIPSGATNFTRRQLFLALTSCLLAIIAVTSILYYRALTRYPANIQTAASSDLTTRKTVAVLAFRNLSGKPVDAWLSAAFPEWLASEISIGGHVHMIPGEQIAALHKDLAWPMTGGRDSEYPPEKLVQINKSLGAGIIITGAFADSGVPSQIRLDIQLLNASTGQLLASLTETGNRDDLFTLAARAGEDLREKLGLLQMSPADAQTARATLPANEKAARLYIEGLERFRALDPIAARNLLEQAVKADPAYPLAHSALAAVCSALGYDLSARAEAGKALELASGLPREQYLEIEATYREATKDWTKAAQIYQTLAMFAPENIEYALRLARVQSNGGEGKEALATLASLRQSRASSEDPRVDYQEAKAYESTGDFQHEVSSAERAIAKAKPRNARQLIGNALIAKAWALDNLSRAKDAEATAREASEVFASIGDNSGVSWALMNIANAVSDEGDHAGAIAGYKQALDHFRETGNEHGIAVALNNMAFDMKDSGNLAGAKKAFGDAIAVCEMTGDTRAEVLAFNGLGTILYREGNLAAAQKMYESALKQFQANGDQDRAARMLRNIALTLEDQGALVKAHATFEEAIALDRQIGSKAELAANLENEGELLLLQGDAAGAQLKCEESERISREVEDKRNSGYALAGIAQVLHVRGAMPDARAKYEAAMKLRTQSGEKGLAAETALLMARFEMDDGNLQPAEQLARQAVDEFTRERRSDEQATALATLADVRRRQHDFNGAQREIRSALTIAGKTQDRGTQLRVGLVAAQVDASTGNVPRAAAELRALVRNCKRFGYFGPELEVRLALGQAELSIHHDLGEALLASVAKEAKQRGFLLISRKAANVAEPKLTRNELHF
jgi:DNA-binding winged helix-turn-helix (wHTH) protein/tetratricopeptide (TPR) repeat protein